MIETNHPCGQSAFRIVQRLFVTLAVAAALAVPLNDAPAQAAPGDLACPFFVGQINFTHALTATNRTSTVSVTAGWGGCVALNGAHSDLKSAAFTGSGTATAAPGLNPCSLVLDVEFEGLTTWSPTGEQSSFHVSLNTNPSAGPLTTTVRIDVLKGVLAGDTGTLVVPPIPNVDCVVNGLTILQGPIGLFLFN